MKLIIFIFVLVSVYNVVNGGVAHSLPDKQTDCSSGTCVDYCDHNGQRILAGEEITEMCTLVRCNEDYSKDYRSCGVGATESCKKLSPDFSLPYPDCCNRVCKPKNVIKIIRDQDSNIV
ncbi:CLUMA_CG015874, isoform A [Clunio marinus]|uniref:CLUMA_CG015874, isoform A n=1 Tax=Clunio marinus TaxID=568069 RepID=A0A1J1ITQ7_9DIPT|nr:CLUMA_CG015874, isoform A [Clunio marinus]